MTIPAAKPTTELLISALTGGDARLRHSFRRTLRRASLHSKGARREELEALAGILDGLGGTGGAGGGSAFAPTLRHLLARVL